jgi:hypothetical protein
MNTRGRQSQYNRLLDDLGAKHKGFAKCVSYLVSLGFSLSQANNAVHVYRKGDVTQARFRLSRDQRNDLLNSFDAAAKTPKECVDYLRGLGCTYRQANSAVYKYRQEKGLIGYGS